VQKYVVSSTMTDPQWQSSTVLSGDPVEEVRALKEQPGQDIVVTGSIRLCHTLIGVGLVDEYRLFVYPVVQGRGRRLFPRRIRVPQAEAGRSEGLSKRHHVLAIRPFLTSVSPGGGSCCGSGATAGRRGPERMQADGAG
jgi:dihydrofolate reductase